MANGGGGIRQGYTARTMRAAWTFVLVTIVAAGGAYAADGPESVVRAFYAGMADGDAARMLSFVAKDARGETSRELGEELSYRCIEVPSLAVSAARVDGETAAVETIAHVRRVPKFGGHPTENRERRSFQLRRDGGQWQITSLDSAERTLATAIHQATSLDAVTALLARNQDLLGPALVVELLRVAYYVGMRGSGRPDGRLTNVAFDIATLIDHAGSKALALAHQANSKTYSLPETIARAEAALRIARETGEPYVIVLCANSLATAYSDGLSLEVEQALREALQYQEKVPWQLVSTTHSNFGHVLFQRGDYAAAYRVLSEGIDVDRARGFEHEAGFKEIHLGRIMDAQNDPELALEHFRRGTQLKTGKPFIIMGHLGMAASFRAMQRWDDAEKAAHQALEIALGTQLKGLIGRSYVAIAELHIERGEIERARTTLRDALAHARAADYHVAELEALLTHGNLELRHGRAETAQQLAQEAVAVCERFDFPRAERYRALLLSARSARAQGQHENAIALYERSIEAIEQTRQRLAGGERQQRLFFEPYHAAFTELADLLLEKDDLERALFYTERSKARLLRDLISNGQPPEDSLSKEDRDRLEELTVALEKANRRAIAARTTTAAAGELAEAEAGQRRTQLALDHFRSEAAARNPRFRLATSGSPVIDAQALSALVRDPALAFVEFAVLDTHVHLFVVSGGKHGATIRHHRIEVTSKDLAARVDRFLADVAGGSLRHRRSARELYDVLLAPAASELATKSVIGIVPDGPLWRVPFDALIDAAGRPLIERAAFFYAPSISTYGDVLARRNALAQLPRSRTLVAFGDPAIAQPRERIRQVYRDVELGPLPDAAREAVMVARLWGGQSIAYTGDQAAEETAKREMERARIVHFAAHGLFDDGNPMFSQIILSPGREQREDGALQAWELMRLQVAADLVVLSACDTARGRFGAGEGLIGLSWALFAGGCPSTVAAQWKLDSRTAADFMTVFHRSLVRDASAPFAKARALRDAKLAVMRKRATAHPFHWAAFVLVGSAD